MGNPEERNHASWALTGDSFTFNDQPQVIVNGNPEVSAYNPVTGEELWSIPVLSGDVAPSLAVCQQFDGVCCH